MNNNQTLGTPPVPRFDQQYASERTRLHDGLQNMQRQAGGGVLLHVVQPNRALRMEAVARDGDREARAMLDLVIPVVKRIAGHLGRTPATCAICGRSIAAMKFSVAIVVPFLTWPHGGVAAPVCWRCGVLPVDVRTATVRACHEVWPEMVVVQQTHTDGGRA